MKLCLQRRQLKFPMIGHPTNLFCCADVAALLLLGWPILQTPYYIMLLWLLVLVCPCATDTICPLWPTVRLVPIISLCVLWLSLCVICDCQSGPSRLLASHFFHMWFFCWLLWMWLPFLSNSNVVHYYYLSY